MFDRTRVAALALSIVLGPPGLADERPAPPLSTGVRAAVQVTAMDLDVVATKDGRPVNDLARDEFVVRVDGKPVAVDYFARIEAGTVHGPDLATASPDLVLDTLRSDSGETYVPRQFLVYFDDQRLLPQERPPVIEALRDFVTRLSPSDRASIVSYNGSTRVLVPFTNSKEDLLDGLLRLEKAAPQGLAWQAQYGQTVRDLRLSRYSARGAIIRSWSDESRIRDRSALQELARSVSALAARSGKRTLLLVTNGYEWYPGQTLAQAYAPTALMQFDQDIRDDLNGVLSKANGAGITIEVFDAKGLASEGDASDRLPSAVNPWSRQQNYRDSMVWLSSGTGGTLTENRNFFLGAVDRVYRDASSYYSVGVTLSAVPGKGRRKVEVSTTRPGVVVRARTGFEARTADDAAVDRVEMALLTPGVAGDFPATLKLGTPESGGGPGRRLAPYVVAVPMSALTFHDDGANRTATIEVTIAAVEDTGARSKVAPVKTTVSIPAADFEKALKEPFAYRGTLKTGKGNLRFVAGVRDVASGRMALASADVRVE